MKVLLYGHPIFSMDMAWGFLQAGCAAEVIHPYSLEHFENILKETNPDLFITMGAPLDLNRSILEYIGKRSTSAMKHVHWDTDGISSKFYRSYSGEGIEMDVIYLSKPDMVFTMCPEMLQLIRSKQIPCEMLHYAYSPISHHPIGSNIIHDNSINVVGQSYLSIAYQNRTHYRYHSIGILIKPLLENNYRVDFYGDHGYRTILNHFWNLDVPAEYFHGYLSYEYTCSTYNRSLVNLVTQNHEHTITKRTFEILGSGGFILSSDNTALRELFTPGRDLAVTSSPEQTLELVEYYKNNPDAYKAIREHAVVSVQDHTYKQRAETIIGKLKELAPKDKPL